MAELTDHDSRFPEAYLALYAQLSNDIEDLDDNLKKMPQLVQDAAELAVAAMDDENACHLALDVIKAEIGQQMRQENEKISEAAIERSMPLYTEIQEARSAYNHAKTYAVLCGDMVRALRIKSALLQKGCDMIVAGYITPSAAYQRRKEEINAVRQARS